MTSVSPPLRTTTLVIPGLVWPTPGIEASVRALDLPGLQALLASFVTREAPATALDDWLARAFSLPAPAPLAALRLAGETLLAEAATHGTHWLCADPVHLRFAQQHLVLGGPEQLQLGDEEMQQLFAGLNAEFGDIGRFHAASGQRGYLQLQAAPKARFTPLDQVNGRPIAYFQPEGEEAARWARLLNEIQVYCHNHGVNQTREAAGLAPVNALWLWGEGALPMDPPRPPAPRIAGDSSILRGLCKLAGVQWLPAQAWKNADWSVHLSLQESVMARDIGAWLQGLQELDGQVFQPLAEQLKGGERDSVQLIAPGDAPLLTIEAKRASVWTFWRRRKHDLGRLLCAKMTSDTLDLAAHPIR